MKWVAIIGLLLSLGALQAELIPADQLTDWTPGVRVGVIGGIPTTRTMFADASLSPYNADKTGTSDATSAIQSALNACPADQYVYLPAGNYKVTGMSIGNNITLRGAGQDITNLLVQAGTSQVITMANNPNYQWLFQSDVTAGNTWNSTTLTLDTTNFSVGDVVKLQWSDNYDTTTIGNGTTYIAGGVTGPTSGGHVRVQMTRVVSKTSTTMTIFPPIIHKVQTGTTLKAAPSNLVRSGAGVEDLTIDGSVNHPFAGVWMEHAYNCWAKNVKMITAANYPFALADCLNCEVTHCYASGGTGGTNGAGYLLGSTACYLYDNIAYRVIPGFEVNGSCGNVIAYNLVEGGADFPYALNINHGPHNSHNLLEGNITPVVQSDGYFGSASQQTLFRNWIHATNYLDAYSLIMVVFNRWNRYNSVVGNILGTPAANPTFKYSFGNPNLGNGDHTGTYQMSQNIFPVDWKQPGTITSGGGTTTGTFTIPSDVIYDQQFRIVFGWAPNLGDTWGQIANINRTSAGNYNGTMESPIGGVWPANGTALVVWPGVGGFQGLDLDVFATYDGGTTNLRANYFLGTPAGIPANEALAPDTLPNSLYLSAKPAFFRSLSWPPFNPEAPGSLTTQERYQKIPAGYRLINGTDPPASAASPTIGAKKRIRTGGAAGGIAP